MECGFAGNADIYGIGIRIGYYTQALAVWFAGFFHFREAQVLQETNKIFLFALVVAGLIYVSKAQTTYAVEAFLLLQIGLVVGLLSVMDSKRYSSRYSRTSVERLISRLTIMGAGLLFNVCFWWRGLDIMLETPCRGPSRPLTVGDRGPVHADNNATYIWFFARFSIYGWLRTLGRVLSLYLAIGSVLTLGFADAVELLQRWRQRKTRKTFIDAAAAHRKLSESEKHVSAVSTSTLQATGSSADPKVTSPNPKSQAQPTPGSTSIPLASQTCGTTPNPKDDTIKTQNNAQTELERLHGLLTIFTTVKQAENFINLVFSVYSKRNALLAKRRSIRLWHGHVTFSVPQSSYEHNGNKCRYRECLWIWLKMQWTSNPSLSQRWTLSLHMKGHGEHTMLRIPRLYQRIHVLTKVSHAPDWRILAIASDVQLSQSPLSKSARVWVGIAMQKLFLITTLIIQVELTINWNNISGLQRLTTLGQLIPFILGVGGLMKVVWSKWCQLRNGVQETHEIDGRPLGEYDLAMEEYLCWKGNQNNLVTSEPGANTATCSGTNSQHVPC